jgi:uncharacterized protein (DUF433 family)
MAATTDIGTLVATSPHIRGGRPHVAGTGVTVQRIAVWHQMGLTAEQIVEQIPHLTLGQVYAALAYYHVNREAIDRQIADDEDAGDVAEALHRQQRGAATH